MYEEDILCAFAAFIILMKIYHNQSFWWDQVLSLKKDIVAKIVAMIKDLLLDNVDYNSITTEILI